MPAPGFSQDLAGLARDSPRFSPSSIRDRSCITRNIWAMAGSFVTGRTSSAVRQGVSYTGTARPAPALLPAPHPGQPLLTLPPSRLFPSHPLLCGPAPRPGQPRSRRSTTAGPAPAAHPA